MAFRLTLLGSGSAGNSAFLETDHTRILVDAGLSGKQIEERMASIGKDPAQLHAILITHEHSDHIQGLRVLANRYRIPIYANRLTRDAVMEQFSTDAPASPQRTANMQWRLFETGRSFAAGDFDIETFSIPHDASDPVGFSVHHGNQAVVFMTDLGHMTTLTTDHAKRADVLILETNYDIQLLQSDPHRPWSVKQRISGRHGHLSNEAAATALETVLTDRLQHLFLSHLSKDCNRPQLAHATIQKKLSLLGATHIQITVAQQAQPCSTLLLQSEVVSSPITPSLFNQPGLSQG
jgi:phosphoribosyl 1,2-cyclic phosphodiesterase